MRGSPRTNGSSDSASFESQGELGQLRKHYNNELNTLKEMFPDWSDDDLLFALQDTDGELEATIAHITEGSYCIVFVIDCFETNLCPLGNTAQWGEVKKKSKGSARSKAPEVNDTAVPPVRAFPGRGSFAGPGPRGGFRGGAFRGADRGGRGGRGRGGGFFPNGHRSNDDANSAIPSGLGEPSAEAAAAIKKDAAQSVDGATSSPAPAKPQNTWAALFKAPPAPPAPKKAPAPPSPPKEEVAPEPSPPKEEEIPAEPESTPAVERLPSPPPVAESPEADQEEPAQAEPEPEPETAVEPEPEVKPEEVAEEVAEPEAPEVPEIKTEEPVQEYVQAPLTEQNLEKVEDVAPPAPTGTQASTITSIAPPKNSVIQAPTTPQTRHAGLSTPKIGSARTSSFSRRNFDQKEAVIMPGNHAIDRTTVQFGSLGLNGAAIDDDDDEPARPEPVEPIAQPAQPTPPGPEASTLPAAAAAPQMPTPVQPPQIQQAYLQAQQPQQGQQIHQQTVQDALPTPRQAPGLPAQPHIQAQLQQQQQATPQPPLGPQSMTSQQMNPQLSNQFNRFGGIEQTPAAQKPYDAFQHHGPQQHTPQTQAAQLPQVTQSQQSYGYPAHHQQQQHHQQSHPAQAGLGGLSSLPEQYNYYGSDLQRGGAPGFNYYSNPYSQPTQEALPRATSGMGSTAADTPSQLSTAPAASRFGQVGEQAAGHVASPAIASLQPTSQAPAAQQTAAHQQYPMQPAYYHPGYYYMNQVFNYDTPYSGSSELNEGFSSYQQFYPSYQTPFAKQQGLYGQPHQNFMSQYSDHASSPASLGGFGGPSSQGRESAAGVNDYGRGVGSQVPQSHPQHASTNFGGLPNFLNSRGLPEQQQLGAGVGQQQSVSQGQSDDSMKPFGDAKPPTGPASNTGLQGQPRPGSATSGGSNLPQQGSQPHGGMGGYPQNLNHHLHGGHQGHQQQQHQSQQSLNQNQQQYQYSMYGQYPNQYGASNTRQGANNWGQYGGH